MMSKFMHNLKTSRSNNHYYPPYVNKYMKDSDLNKELTFDNEFKDSDEIKEPIELKEDSSQNKDTDEKSINILGFNLCMDDIIIIAIIIFLCFENKRDYVLIILLGLMLFNISFDKILDESKDLNFLRKYINF